jgi:hypothetical protein
MEIYTNSGGAISSGQVVTVRVQTPVTGTPTESCSVTTTNEFVVVDVTEGTIDGTPCDALQRGLTDGDGFFDGRFAHGVGDEYNITFENGDRVVGNYSLVTRTTAASTTPHLNSTVGLSPYVTDAVYNVSVRFAYETSEVRYVTRIRVAPGEPDA